jgi:hypothetical protein
MKNTLIEINRRLDLVVEMIHELGDMTVENISNEIQRKKSLRK